MKLELDPYAFEDIVVTATKRSAIRVQDFPASISAFNDTQLERLNGLDFDEFIVHVPGTNFIDNGRPGRGHEVASIRGLSPVADNTVRVVAEYLDGAPRFGRNYRFFYMREVSILQRPQGPLWGAQAIGCLLVYNSKYPDLTGYSGKMGLDVYTSRDDGGLSNRLFGHVNVPVNEYLAFRLAEHWIDESGYVDNIFIGDDDVNDLDEQAWRVSTLFQPINELPVKLIYHGNDLHSDAPTYFDPALVERRVNDRITKQPADQNYDLINLIVDVGKLSYNGSYFNLDNTFISAATPDSGSFSPLALNETTLDQHSWTHELRLASMNDEHRFNWLVDLYYDDLDEIDLNEQTEVQDPILPPLNGVGFKESVVGGPEDTTEKAVFGELTLDITDQLEVLVGGRWFDWEVDNRQELTFFGTDFQQSTGTVGDDGFLYKGQLNYKPTEDGLYLAASFAYTKNEFTDDAILFPENSAPPLITEGEELRQTRARHGL